jgi:peptidase E
MDDFSGLGFVNFFILPHSNSKDFVKSNLRMVEKLPEYNQAVVALYDNQTIWVEDGKLEILAT